MSSLLSDEALAQMELNERTECELLIVSNGMDCGKLAALIESMSQVASQPSSVISDSRGLVLDRRRINDDSDSDIDLSDL